jgi:hypothetical protein
VLARRPLFVRSGIGHRHQQFEFGVASVELDDRSVRIALGRLPGESFQLAHRAPDLGDDRGWVSPQGG